MAQRYQREIEEILEQTGDALASKRSVRRGGGVFRGLGRGGSSGSGGRWWRITPSRIFVASVALLLTALVMRSLAPGLVGLFAWGGLLLFILAYALFFVRPGRGGSKRWRGLVVEGELAPRRRRFPRWLHR